MNLSATVRHSWSGTTPIEAAPPAARSTCDVWVGGDFIADLATTFEVTNA